MAQKTTGGKRILLAILAIALLLAALGVIWYINKSRQSNTGDQVGAQGEFPIVNAPDRPAVDEPKEETSTVNDENPPRLFKLADGPIAGAAAFTDPSGAEKVRYFSKKGGEIREIDMETLEDKLLAVRLVENVHDAYWNEDASRYLIRYLDIIDGNEVIKTYWSDVSTSTDTVKSGFFPDNIREITTSYDHSKVLYVCDEKCDFRAEGGSFLISSNFDGTEKKQELYTPLTQWQIQWPAHNFISITSAPSFNIPGYAYRVAANNRLIRLVGDVPALTTLISRDGNKVLYSGSGEEWISGIYSVQDDTTVPFNKKLVPEKCAWRNTDPSLVYCAIPKNFDVDNYPDNWYRGEISYNDNLWSINTDLITDTHILVKPSREVGEEIDATHLFFGPDDRYLYFTNKKDGSLWAYRVEG